MASPTDAAALLSLAFPVQSQSLLGFSSRASPDAQGILFIIHAAGGRIHESFFSHAFSWREDGELALVDIPVPELLTDQRMSMAVNELLGLGHLQAVDAGFLVIHPAMASRLQCSSAWRLAALQAVCKSFPRYPVQILW